MFPQYDSKHIFDEIERGCKLFGKTEKKLQLAMGGYVVRKTNDGSIWGTADGKAYSIFVEKEDAEIVKKVLSNHHKNNNWEIIYLGCIWLDKDPREK